MLRLLVLEDAVKFHPIRIFSVIILNAWDRVDYVKGL
jgi:hypothetical protein